VIIYEAIIVIPPAYFKWWILPIKHDVRRLPVFPPQLFKLRTHNRVIHKVSQRGTKPYVGLILLWGNFLLIGCWLVVCWSLFWKLGETFGTSSFHLLNFEKILGSKEVMSMGLGVVNPSSAYARLAWPTHLMPPPHLTLAKPKSWF
jgi:hypothetical protein